MGDAKSIFAFDEGFSFCKGKRGEQLFKFPTAIAQKKQGGFEGAAEDGLYEFNGRTFRVGDDALKSDSKKYHRDISFLLDYAPLLTAHALTLCEDKEMPERLVVGLPLFEHHKHKDELKKRLSAFMVNQVTYKFDVKVVPQGIGTLADYVKTQNPDRDEDGYVFDVGFNTVIALRYHALKSQQDGSRQYDQFGISRPLEELINALKIKHGYSLDMMSINAAFQKGEIRGDVGGRIDIKALAAPIMEDYLDELLTTLQNDFGRYFNASHKLIIAGGGAYYLADLMPDKYKDKIFVPDQAEYSNVRGYDYLGG